MQEVEMKAHLTDETEKKVLDFLHQNGVFLEKTEKKDVYFRHKNSAEIAPAFRVRTENGKCTVTQKQRNLSKDGVEMNTEREFEVVSESDFLAFVQHLGFEKWYEKEKNVEKYTINLEEKAEGKALAELVFLPPLGKFLEVEIVCTAEKAEKAAQKIFDFFKKLDLENSIEKNPYFVLLQEKNAI